MKTHDKDFFYKYVTAETAKAILKSGCVRWSSPRLFNDPFDIQFDLHVSFSEDEWREVALSRLTQCLHAPRPTLLKVSSLKTGLFNLLLDQLQKTHPDISDEQIRNEFEAPIREGWRRMNLKMPDRHKEMREIVSNLCVFCVTEVPDSLLMWAHYADSHTGAVLKYRCLPEYDTALCVAEPVNYVKDLPELATPEELVASLFGEAIIDNGKLLRTITTSKSREWSYEREWRLVANFENQHELERGYADYPFLPQELIEITFGCRIRDSDISELHSLAGQKYPHVSFRQARPHQKSYALEFETL